MNNVGLCRPCLITVAGNTDLQQAIDWVSMLLSGGLGEEVQSIA